MVHPTRDIREPVGRVREWAQQHGVRLVQVEASCQQQRVAQEGATADCDLLVSIGGDGTALAAIRAGVTGGRPVLAAACGSLGVLTAVPAGDVVGALDRFSQGDWMAQPLPALDISRENGEGTFALNDVVVVRAGAGQARLSVEVDGELFARLAGDGCVVSTPLGSSAYALAARGPLVAPELEAALFTPLPTHGGTCPPFVAAAGAVIHLRPLPGHGGARLEIDGRVVDSQMDALTITFRPGVASVVKFPDQPPFLGVLRERHILTDSPRILAEDAPSNARPR